MLTRGNFHKKIDPCNVDNSNNWLHFDQLKLCEACQVKQIEIDQIQSLISKGMVRRGN
jgi:hypothetical protein